MLWGLALAVLLAVFGASIGRLFSKDPDFIAPAVLYFLIVPITFGLQGFVRIVATSWSVIDRERRAHR